MTFLRPDLLALAPLLAALFTIAVGAHWRRLRRLGRIYELPALQRLIPVRLDRFPTGRLLCLVGAGVAIGLAAAGPAWVPREPPEPPPPLDIAIAVDLSVSMTAVDTEPSRATRAREVIATLTEELPSVRFSLVVFAGWPYMLLPPTDDPAVVRYFAQAVRVDLVGPLDRGTAFSSTLPLARRTLEARATPGARQAVLVLSDGDVYEDESVVLGAASSVAAEGVEVWVAGVGTEAGAPLSMEGEPLLDASGAPVVATLDSNLLRAIADAGGGRYEDVTEDGGLRALVANLRELSGDDGEDPSAPFDATFLLTLLAIPLLLWDGAVDAGRGWTATRTGRARP